MKLEDTSPKLEESPVFRKIIIPWYDSEPVCLLMIALMDIAFLFGYMGIDVARESHEYYAHLWVPVLVMVMSGGVIVSTTIRLVRRFIHMKKYAALPKSKHIPSKKIKK